MPEDRGGCKAWNLTAANHMEKGKKCTVSAAGWLTQEDRKHLKGKKCQIDTRGKVTNNQCYEFAMLSKAPAVNR